MMSRMHRHKILRKAVPDMPTQLKADDIMDINIITDIMVQTIEEKCLNQDAKDYYDEQDVWA